jgi:hypothetical protein
MTIPAIITLEQCEMVLYNSAGTILCERPLNLVVTELEGKVLPGVTAPQLDHLRFSIPATEEEAALFTIATLKDNLRIVSLTFCGDATTTLWGVVVKASRVYSGYHTRVDIALKGTEYLLHARECYIWAGEALPISIVSGKADDYAKKIVRYTMLPGTCGNDADGNSRDWDFGGTLVVEADAGECTDVISLDVNQGWVDNVINDLHAQYTFDYELRPSISGGAITWTFRTKAPRGGEDRTVGNSDGNDPVIINDIAGMIPGGEYHWQMLERVTALHGSGKTVVETDATGITEMGRWEGSVNTITAEDTKIALGKRGDKSGASFSFEALGVNGQCAWMQHFNVGDLVTRNNTILGLASESDTIAALAFILDAKEKRLIPQITWGEPEGNIIDRLKSSSSGGGWADPMPDMPPLMRIGGTPLSIAGSNITGTLSTVEALPYDHQHKGVLKAGATEVAPVVGVFTLASADGSIVFTPNSPIDGTMDMAAPDSLLWTKVAGTPDYLVPTDITNDVKVGTLITLDASIGRVTARQLYQGTNDRISLAAGGGTEICGTTNVYFAVGGIRRVVMTPTQLRPISAGLDLGSIGMPWGNSFFHTGAYLDFASGGAANIILGSDGDGQYEPKTLADLGIAPTTSLYWTKVAGSPDYLVPTDITNDVKVGTLITLDASAGSVLATYFYKTANTNVYFPSTSELRLSGNTAVSQYIGGTEICRSNPMGFRPTAANMDLGNTSFRWRNLWLTTRIVCTGGEAAKPALVWDGTGYSPGTLTMSDLSDGHAAVTLSATANSNLLSLTGQEIGLDTQTANYIFAGPTSGAAAAPTFRAMVLADLYDHVHVYSRVMSWSAGGTQYDSGATTPTLSGKTADWALIAGTVDLDGLPLKRKGGSTEIYILDWTAAGAPSLQTVVNKAGTDIVVLALSGATGPTYTRAAVGTQGHTHNMSGGVADAAVSSHSHKIKVDTTIKTGSPVAP